MAILNTDKFESYVTNKVVIWNHIRQSEIKVPKLVDQKKKHLEDKLHVILFDESKEAKENASFTWDFCSQCKDTLSRLRQFLATARPLKMMHNIFIPP